MRQLTPAQRATIYQTWPAKPIPLSALAANKILFGGACLLRGWSFVYAGGTTAIVDIIDGQDANGTEVGRYQLGSGIGATQWIGTPGVLLSIGLFFASTQFPFTGAFWVTALDDLELDRMHEYHEAAKGQAPYGKGN